MKTLLRYGRWIVALVVLVCITVLVVELKSCERAPIEVENSNPGKQIALSPEEIRAVEHIGQWVFLTVEAEEMVDTVRKHLILSNDELSRIYVGTLHFGIDMTELHGKEWLTCHGDTATLTLPRVKLMDKRFINEAKTRTFFQKGDWDSQALKALYAKAQRQMLKRGHTQANINKAQKKAQAEVETFFRAFGFNTVEISFER